MLEQPLDNGQTQAGAADAGAPLRRAKGRSRRSTSSGAMPGPVAYLDGDDAALSLQCHDQMRHAVF